MSKSPDPEEGALRQGQELAALAGATASAPENGEASSATARPVGAAPIRWTWWALAILVSIGLWLLLARVFGWF